MKRLFLVLALLSAGIGFYSCTPEPHFDNVPVITFESISKNTKLDGFGNKTDSLVIAVKFQDGDGDLGVSSTLKEDSLLYKTTYNYLVRTFRQVKGAPVEISQTISNSGNFPRLRDDNKIGPIEGTLSRAILIYPGTVPKNDTLSFKIKIMDRARNVSNEISTTQVVVNQ